MQRKTIVNIVIGSSSLKVIHCEKFDTEVIIKNSVILETNSNLYLNKNTLNIGFIEDKLRMFFFENKIKNGKICYTLPDYLIDTRIVNKQQVITNDYISGLIKTRQLHELIDEPVLNEDNLVFDCQVINRVMFNTTDENDGSSDIMVSSIDSSISKSLKQMSKRLKMTPIILEPEINGLLRLINMFEITDNYMIIDIGEIYTKIITIFGTAGTPTLDYQIIPSGMYSLDNLIGKLFACPPMIATDKRINCGLNTESEAHNGILLDVVKDTLVVPIIEQLNDIQSTYDSLQYIKKYLICGGGWGTPGLKDAVQSNTLGLFDEKMTLDDFSCFTKNLVFDNDIVKDDIISNINSYASCLGLTLRGGL